MELKKKEKLLQEKLLQKVEELKKICLREAVRAAPHTGVGQVGALFSPWALPGALCVPQELTGKMPKEYPLGAGEEPPQVRRRVGTAFKLDDNLLPSEEVSVGTQQGWGGQATGQSLLWIIQLFPECLNRTVDCMEWEILMCSALLSATL